MDIRYLKDTPIAVLGAGAMAKSIAADCKLAGREVRMCELEQFAERNFFQVEQRGIKLYGDQLNLNGFERSGTAHIDMITTDVAKAVKGAGLIVVATTALGHVPFFKQLVPALEDGQFIHIVPDNCGTFLLRKMMREMNCTKNVVIGGYYSGPYGTRVQNVGGVVMPVIKAYIRDYCFRGAALPACDSEIFIESSKYLPCFDAINNYGNMETGDTAFDNIFSNTNPVIHCPATILGVSTMENFGVVFGTKKTDFSIYSHAHCPSISEVQLQFYKEEERVAKAMGVGIAPIEDKYFFNRSSVYGLAYMGPKYFVPFDDPYEIQFGTGPFSLENRYITEDIPVGCSVYSALGKKYGVETPIIDAMILLASVMIKRDLRENAYTLDYLDIGHMTHEELMKYVREGIYTPKK